MYALAILLVLRVLLISRLAAWMARLRAYYFLSMNIFTDNQRLQNFTEALAKREKSC